MAALQMLAMPLGIAALCALQCIPSRVALTANFSVSVDQIKRIVLSQAADDTFVSSTLPLYGCPLAALCRHCRRMGGCPGSRQWVRLSAMPRPDVRGLRRPPIQSTRRAMSFMTISDFCVAICELIGVASPPLEPDE